MLSVIVYGRNDAHGYNLHKRVALSLNSIADTLTDPDDEIVFVDWNTPEGLPPFPVSIGDTLTPKARSLLKIVRVPPSVHCALARGRTSKVVIEPYARNVGIRRANPHNTWILSTNTDILVTTRRRPLSEVVSRLEPGYYGLPRFELPEWMWEALPRTDPDAVRHLMQNWTRTLLVEAEVSSFPFARFDAPGDFQLVDRETLERIGAFDETMVKGWHVDSNLARRLHDLYGETLTVAADVSIHHCNHTRSETHYHQSIHEANDLETYVFGKVKEVARSGFDDWGLRGVELDVIQLADFDDAVEASLSWLSRHHRANVRTSLLDARDRLAGVPTEVTLPFIADSILVDPSVAHIVYAGGRPDLVAALRELCSVRPGLHFTDLTDTKEVAPVMADTVLVVDLTPPEANLTRHASRLSELSAADRASIRKTLKAVDREIRSELASGESRRRYLVVNGEANELEAVVTDVLTLLPIQYYSRLRVGRIKEGINLPSERGEAVAIRMLSLIDATSSFGKRQHQRFVDADPITPAIARHLGGNLYWRFRGGAARARRRLRSRIARHTLVPIPRDLDTPGQ